MRVDREQELREKVIKGLECCSSEENKCLACPYYGVCYVTQEFPFRAIFADAIALLKAQEANDAIPLKWMREKCKLYCSFGDYNKAAWINDLVHWWQRETREAQAHAETPEAVE